MCTTEAAGRGLKAVPINRCGAPRGWGFLAIPLGHDFALRGQLATGAKGKRVASVSRALCSRNPATARHRTDTTQ